MRHQATAKAELKITPVLSWAGGLTRGSAGSQKYRTLAVFFHLGDLIISGLWTTLFAQF